MIIITLFVLWCALGIIIVGVHYDLQASEAEIRSLKKRINSLEEQLLEFKDVVGVE